MYDAEIHTLLNESLQLESSGQIGAALQKAHHCLEQALASNDLEGCARAWVRIGEIQYRLGHFAEMRAAAEEALACARRESHAYADALILLGIHLMEVSLPAEAESCFLQAVDLCRRLGYAQSHFRALHNLVAGVYSQNGQFALCLSAGKEAFRIAQALGSPQQAAPLITMAYVYLLTGQHAEARAQLDQAASLVTIPLLFQGYCAWLRGALAHAEGDLSAVPTYYAQAFSVAETFGDSGLNIFLRIWQSRYEQAIGNTAAAYDWADKAVGWAKRTSNQRMLGRALTERGHAAWLKGDLLSAERDLREAMQILRTRQQRYDLARAALFLAALLHRQQRPEAVETWREAAQAIHCGGYAFLLDQERALAYPLLAAFLNYPDQALASISAQLIEQLQRFPSPPLQVETLGRFHVRQGKRAVAPQALRRRRAGELLILLLLAPKHSLSSEQIAEALCPERPPDAARIFFHHATSALRRALEPELPEKFPSRYLEVQEGQATLRLPPASWVDFEAFEAHVRQGEWEEALRLYSGEFLPEYRYAEWTVAPRERLSFFYKQALLGAAKLRLEQGCSIEALDACLRLLEVEPWQEEAVLLGMRACVALGDLPGARRLYLALEKALREDLGARPQEELRAFYLSLTPPPQA